VINADDSTPDIEKLIQLDPDLFVTITWRPGEGGGYWGVNDDLLPRMLEVVPIVAIAATGSAAVSTERFGELAGLLGADLNTPELVAAKTAYDAEVTAFSALTKEKADLVSLFVYADSQGLYAAKAPDWADLAWYQELGLNIVDPDVAVGEFWENLSWEQALKYPADIVFNTTRGEALTNQDLIDHPTFGQHPAIKAGQLGAWNQDFIMSYQGLTAALTEMTKTLSAAKKL
jgi:iron complex transport system substrate-binding protein